MKRQKLWKRIVGAALAAALLVSVSACGKESYSMMNTSSTKLSEGTTDLMSGVKAASAKSSAEVSEAFLSEYSAFACTLFQQVAFQEALSSVEQDKSMMISPLSVMAALCMTLNGADGETAAQMRRALAEGYIFDSILPIDDLNEEYSAFVQSLPSDKKAKLSIANSIWLREGQMKPKQDFLQTNANYYNAGVYSAKFDESTCKDINQWVSDNTDGMVEKMVDDIPDNAMLYLINALAFDAEWQEIYSEDMIHEGVFYGTTGDQTVDMMSSTESGYLDDGQATGFIKPYASGYSFVAMLPNEGVSLDEYIGSLDAAKLRVLLKNSDDRAVNVGIPKFTSAYEKELSDVLKAMGMTDAFEPEKADFSKIGTTESGDSLYISRVLHKTRIGVDARGTKAGAATAVEFRCGSAMMTPFVYLDRPFLYMIIENETYLPVFMGTVMNVA